MVLAAIADLPAIASELPEPPPPVGSYSAVIIRGNLGFVSGQFPLDRGEMIQAACKPASNLDRLREAARVAALNVAAQIVAAVKDRQSFGGLCRVDGIIAAPPTFSGHALVLDAASETFRAVFGEVLGAHARSAISSPGLPGKAAIELVVTFSVRA